MSAAADIPVPVPTWRLLAYGQLGLPLAVLTLPLYVLLPSWYADGLGLGLATVGGVLLAARLWDVVTDPLIGVLSDRRIGALGRRKPWVALGLPVLLTGIWLLFFPGPGPGAMYLLVASLVFYFGATMVMLPYLAWGAELTNGYHERSRVTGAREGFVIVGTVVAAGVVALLAESPGSALRWLGIALLVVLPVSVLAVVAAVPDPAPAATRTMDWRAGVRLIGANRPFRSLVSAWLLNGLANGLPASLFLLFVSYRLDRPEMAGLFLLLYFGTGLAGIPLWLAASRCWGKHRAWIVAMLASCAFFAAVPFLGTGDTYAFAAVCMLTGMCLGADLVLPPSMQADVVDLDTERTGRARTGLFFALWNIATKLSLALAVGIAFPLLDLAGFATGSATNGPVALAALAGLYGAAPVVLKLAAVALMMRYGRTMAEAGGFDAREAQQGLAPGKANNGSTVIDRFELRTSDSRV